MANRKCVLVLLVLAVSGALAGCGGSSKPAYCSSLEHLRNSVKDLPTNILHTGTQGIESAFAKVQKEAHNVVDHAKGDFPTETSALRSSVDALSSTVNELKHSPSVGTATRLPGEVSALVTAVDSFVSATRSKCG